MAIGGVAVLAAQFTIWLPEHCARPDGNALDLAVYFQTAQRLARGQPIYDDCPRPSLQIPTGCFLYPPPFAALLKPLGRVSLRRFQGVVYGLLLVAFWIYAWALARLAFGRATLFRVLGAAALLQLTPGTAQTMSIGNVDLEVWALVALGLSGARYVPALVCAAAIKIYPIIPLGVLALRRPRLVPPAAIAAGAIVLLTLAIAGPAVFLGWLRVGIPSLTAGTFAPANFSLSVGVLRLAARLGFLNSGAASLPWAARLFLGVAPLAAIGAASCASRRRTPTAQAAILVCVAVWTAPICWWYQFPIALIPGAVWLRRASDRLNSAGDPFEGPVVAGRRPA